MTARNTPPKSVLDFRKPLLCRRKYSAEAKYLGTAFGNHFVALKTARGFVLAEAGTREQLAEIFENPTGSAS